MAVSEDLILKAMVSRDAMSTMKVIEKAINRGAKLHFTARDNIGSFTRRRSVSSIMLYLIIPLELKTLEVL